MSKKRRNGEREAKKGESLRIGFEVREEEAQPPAEAEGRRYN
jgi:hypothetical protein